MNEPLEIRSQLELESKLRLGFAEIDKGKGTPFNEFWEELEAALDKAENYRKKTA